MTLTVAAIVVAAGRGLRAGGDKPKQYRSVGTRSELRLHFAPGSRANGDSQGELLYTVVEHIGNEDVPARSNGQ